jgi:hypothetical protein
MDALASGRSIAMPPLESVKKWPIVVPAQAGTHVFFF